MAIGHDETVGYVSDEARFGGSALVARKALDVFATGIEQIVRAHVLPKSDQKAAEKFLKELAEPTIEPSLGDVLATKGKRVEVNDFEDYLLDMIGRPPSW